MRAGLLIPILLAAGCGGSSEPEEKKSARAASLDAGQYEMTSEVTRLGNEDDGAPAINTPAGTRATHRACVRTGHQVPSALLSGEGYSCSYANYYFRNGRINALLNCTRDGLQGSIAMSVDGTFENDAVTYTRNVRTSLASTGDVVIDHRVTGRRVGDCPAEEADKTSEASDQ